ANYYMAFNRQKEAKALLDDIVKTSPENFAAAKMRLAALAVADHDQKSAYALIDEVLTKNSKNADALVAKTDLLLSDTKLDDALTTAREAANVAAKSAAVQYELGRVLAARKDLDEAMSAYTEALKQSPGMTPASAELARVAVVLGKPDIAIQSARD